MQFLIERRQTMLILGISVLIMVVFGLLGMLAINNPAYESIRHLFETKYRQNVATWYTSIVFLSAALLAGLISWQQYQQRSPMFRYWLGIVGILLLLSIDGVTEFYGLIVVSQHDRAEAGLLFGWFLPTALVIAAMVAVYVPFVKQLPPEIRVRFTVAVLLAGGGGVGTAVVNRLSFPPEYELLSTLQLLDEVSAGRLRTYIVLLMLFQTLQWVGAVLMIDTLLRYLNRFTQVNIEFAPRT